MLAQLELEVDNFRAAYDWAMQSGRAEDAWRLAGALWLFWQRNRAEEGVSRLAAALETPGGDPLGRAKALQALADLTFYCGDLAGCQRYGEQSLPLAEAAGDAKTIGRAVNMIGVTGVYMQELDAVDHLERALVLHRSTDDAYFWVDSLIGMVLAGWFTGDAGLIKRAADEALEVGRASGNPTVLSRALGMAVIAASARGDLDEWEAPADEAIAITLELRDEVIGPITLGFLARYHGLRGCHDDALEAAETALSRSQAVNNVQGIAVALWARAITERDADRDTAMATLAHAHDAAMTVGLTPLAAECAAMMAVVSIAAGDLTAARESVATAAGLADGHYGQGARGWALQAAGELALAEDNLDEATAAIHDALTAWTEIGNRLGVVAALELLVHLNVHANRSLEAARLLGAIDAERERAAMAGGARGSTTPRRRLERVGRRYGYRGFGGGPRRGGRHGDEGRGGVRPPRTGHAPQGHLRLVEPHRHRTRCGAPRRRGPAQRRHRRAALHVAGHRQVSHCAHLRQARRPQPRRTRRVRASPPRRPRLTVGAPVPSTIATMFA